MHKNKNLRIRYTISAVINLAGGEPYQYTIPDLTKTKRYFVRLFAYNARGDSAACDKTGLNCDGKRLSGIPDGNP